MKLTLGFSPCPNDTFIFDAMVNGKIDTEGLQFDYFITDVEELNKKALTTGTDITKISCHAYAYVADKYLILDSGSALGYGNGPLLVSRRNIDVSTIDKLRIAIPGRLTTANMLFSIAWPEALNKTEFLFSDITDALKSDEADAGLIIHETRFTYKKEGLVKIADLGEYWEHLTGLPVPLGVIAVRRQVPYDTALKVNRIIRRSIEFAKSSQTSEPASFISLHSKEMDKEVMNNHIRLFVNDFSLHLGDQGKKALSELYRIASAKRIIPAIHERIFLT